MRHGLPDGMSPEAVRLVEELRALRKGSRLTLTELGSRTHYSKSSWERWLNGHRLPPLQAVERLLDAVGADDRDRVLLLWAQADAEHAVPRSEPQPQIGEVPAAADEPAANAQDGQGETGRRGWSHRRRLSLTAIGAVTVAGVVASVVSNLPTAHTPAGAVGGTASATNAVEPLSAPDCRAAGCAARDPQAERCGADARTIAMTAIAGAYIYVRYSPACQSAWARMTDAAAGDTIQILDPAHAQSYRIRYGLDGFSPMIDASHGDWVRACGATPLGSGCTDVITDPATAVPVTAARPALPSSASTGR
ncbi:helix-turn-helix domain-containing protein [Streptacidiphilus sp. EB103A]|uniref:helix-turn-helix domain-containing protein n=1 Tax=Streptacidiphilus sp. EB103A TaxID=3156275 RepID=UPI003516BF9E